MRKLLRRQELMQIVTTSQQCRHYNASALMFAKLCLLTLYKLSVAAWTPLAREDSLQGALQALCTVQCMSRHAANTCAEAS